MASDTQTVPIGGNGPKILKKVDFCFKEPLPVETSRKLTFTPKSVLKKSVPVVKESEKIGLGQTNSSPNKTVPSGTPNAVKMNNQDIQIVAPHRQGSQVPGEEMLSGTSSSSPGSTSNPTHIIRSYKEITDLIKTLHKATDELLERSCKLHCKYAESVFKAATLFDPSTTYILNGGEEITGGLKLGNPNEMYLKSGSGRAVIDKRYTDLTERLGHCKPDED